MPLKGRYYYPRRKHSGERSYGEGPRGAAGGSARALKIKENAAGALHAPAAETAFKFLSEDVVVIIVVLVLVVEVVVGKV